MLRLLDSGEMVWHHFLKYFNHKPMNTGIETLQKVGYSFYRPEKLTTTIFPPDITKSGYSSGLNFSNELPLPPMISAGAPLTNVLQA